MDNINKVMTILSTLHNMIEKLENEHLRLGSESFKMAAGALKLYADDDIEPEEALEIAKNAGRIEAYTEEMKLLESVTKDLKTLLQAMAGQEEGA